MRSNASIAASRRSRCPAQRMQGAQAIGHVVGMQHLFAGQCHHMQIVRKDAHAQRNIAKGSASGAVGVGSVGARAHCLLGKTRPLRRQFSCHPAPSGFARAAQRAWVDNAQLLGNIALGGQAQDPGLEAGVQIGVH